MRMSPINAALRVSLELVGLAGIALLGGVAADGLAAWIVGAVALIGATAVWATFRVPDDPGPAPVAVSGRIRLAIETAFFATAIAGWAAISPVTALVFAALLAAHYATAAERLRWLLTGAG